MHTYTLMFTLKTHDQEDSFYNHDAFGHLFELKKALCKLDLAFVEIHHENGSFSFAENDDTFASYFDGDDPRPRMRRTA